jgi:hypothetical protein
VLKVNYRNTRQILDFARVQVDGDDFSDLDGRPPRRQLRSGRSSDAGNTLAALGPERIAPTR